MSLSEKVITNAASSDYQITDTIKSGFSDAIFAYISIDYITTASTSSSFTTHRIQPLNYIIYHSIPFYIGSISGFIDDKSFTYGAINITLSLSSSSLTASRKPTCWDSDGDPFHTKYGAISGSVIIFG